MRGSIEALTASRGGASTEQVAAKARGGEKFQPREPLSNISICCHITMAKSKSNKRK